MKDPKLPASDSYDPYKISNLKDENYSAAYLSPIFGEEEEGDWKLKIVPKALRDVFEALGKPNMSAEYGKLHLSNLDLFLSGEGSATIYVLASWLKALELKLSVAVDEGEKGEDEGSVGGAELAQVGSV